MGAGRVAEVDSPVTLIEGIGAASQTELQEINLYYVFDLLRASAEQIHAAVNSLASIEQVRGWRSMAILLQIQGMTNQWAEALVKSDIRTIEEFIQRTVPQLQTHFSDAQTSGWISQAPSETEIYELLLDATHINYTGSLNGTVRDPNGIPIAGVEATIGIQHAVTDARGRFRLLRIQLGIGQRLILRKSGLETVTIDDPPLTHNNDLVAVAIYEMVPTAVSGPIPNTRLSEFHGDQLPPLSEFSMTTEAHSKDQLRNGDIFVLHKFYSNGSEAELTSKFLDFEEGKFIVLNFKVPIAQLPANPKLKQKYHYREGEFKQIKLNAARMRYFRGLRCARKEFSGSAQPQTLIERDMAIQQYAVYLQQRTTF